MATPAPLFDPKTFSAEQLASLNNVEGQSLSQSNTAAQIIAAQKLSPNIPVGDTKSVNPLDVRNPEVSSIADMTVAGARAGVDAYNNYLALLQGGENSAAKTEAEGLRSEISQGLDTLEGRGAAQLAAEEEAGVNERRNQLTQLNTQIATLTAEFDKLNESNYGRPVTMDSIIGTEAQIRRQKAVEVGGLAAISSALQGQVAEAQRQADRAVDLEYEDRETRLDIMERQLKLLQPELDAEEKQRSQALELYLTDQRAALDEQKSTAKGFQNDKLDAITKGMPVAVAQQVQALFDQGRVDEAYSILGGYVRKSSGGSGSDTFTQSQLNKGASVARIPLADFEMMDVDDQNFFINKASEINKRIDKIDEAFANGGDPRALEEQISESDAPDAVKDTLVRYLKSVFPSEAFGEPGPSGIRKAYDWVTSWM